LNEPEPSGGAVEGLEEASTSAAPTKKATAAENNIEDSDADFEFLESRKRRRSTECSPSSSFEVHGSDARQKQKGL